MWRGRGGGGFLLLRLRLRLLGLCVGALDLCVGAIHTSQVVPEQAQATQAEKENAERVAVRKLLEEVQKDEQQKVQEVQEEQKEQEEQTKEQRDDQDDASDSEVAWKNGGASLFQKAEDRISEYVSTFSHLGGGAGGIPWYLEPIKFSIFIVLFFSVVRLIWGGAPYLPSKSWFVLVLIIPFPLLAAGRG